MNPTQITRAQFVVEPGSNCPGEEGSPRQRPVESWLLNAVDNMLTRALAEEGLPVSRDKVGLGIGCSVDMEQQPPSPAKASAPAAWALERRTRRFALGRSTARAALREIGVECAWIGRGDSGEPLWPQNIRGSITHCFPWSIAVAAECPEPLAVGIDVENIQRLNEFGIVDLICSAREREWVFAGDLASRLVMIFSAKEAIYKAFYPFCGRYIDFKDVELHWRDSHTYFECRSVIPPMIARDSDPLCHVYCQLHGELVVSLTMCRPVDFIERDHVRNLRELTTPVVGVQRSIGGEDSHG